MNFPFICSNIPTATAYVVYVSQLIRYSRACGSYQDFLTRKLLNQGFPLAKMKTSFRKIYDRHHDLVNRYGIYVAKITTNMFHLPHALAGPFLIHDLSTRVTRWVPLVEQELFTLWDHLGVRVTWSLAFCVVFCRSLFSLFVFLFCYGVVCPSSIYGFLLHIWYLQTLLIWSSLSLYWWDNQNEMNHISDELRHCSRFK